MASLTDIVARLDSLLDPGSFDDLGPNGLQVPGAEQVTKIATGVTAQLELFERAAGAGAQLVLCHHGLLWDFLPRRIDRKAQRRLKALFDADLSLVAYHLPLDAHPEVGNNALIADGLGCEAREPFGVHRGRPIGIAGRFAGDGVPAGELVQRVRDVCGREPLVFDAGPERVRSIGIVSGGAARDVSQALDAGLDAFLTGEPTESVMNDAREGGLHFIAAGHYATETFGVRRLGDLLAERFGVHHVFLDIPNPV